MGERNGPYPAGVPAWLDLTTTDPAAARAFYGELFGWAFEVGGEETGHYTMCRLGGRDVVGMNGMPAPAGRPAAWTTYLASDDVDATVAAVTAAGGTVVMAPMDVMDVGRMAAAVDPTGAVVAFWQAGTHIGSGLVNEPGCVVWNELQTRDLDAAAAFYGAVCGYGYDDMGDGDTFRYKVIKVGDRAVGGMLAMGEGIPPDVPANWMPHFAVTDVDAAAAAVTRLGGTVLVPLTDSEFGRWCVVADPQGAVSTLMHPTQVDP